MCHPIMISDQFRNLEGDGRLISHFGSGEIRVIEGTTRNRVLMQYELYC
jgi:hypothetical protein